jgi:fatty-acyl-CoA synthase
MSERLVNIGDWIQQWSAIRPNATAIIADDVPCSYRELDRRINKLARALTGLGVKKGDRVAVLLHNCREYIEVFFSLAKMGAIIVPINWRLAVPEMGFILRDSGAKVMIFEGEFTENVIEVRREAPLECCIHCSPYRVENPAPAWACGYEALLAPMSDQELEVEERAGDTDPHIIMYTSGTTGQPKGAVLSHRKTFFNVLNADIFFDLTTRDRMIVTRPMFHSGGLIVDSAPVLYKGGTIIVKRRFRPMEILETAQKYQVTVMELPATVYQFILNECNLGQYDLTSVRCCFTGGERVSAHLLQSLADKGLVVSQIYGLTEASTIFWLPGEEARERIGSVGHPIFHGKVKIVDDNGNPVRPGTSGEVIVKGPIVMSGYWQRQDLTDEVIRDGWLHTGDIARMDGEGFVYIMDRKKDMYISGGENVYPAEIEKLLLAHPNVADAAVVGVPDEKWGEVGKAFIVLKDGQNVDADDVLHFLRDKLAKYKMPRYIEFMDSLPKTASDKIRKYALTNNGEEKGPGTAASR